MWRVVIWRTQTEFLTNAFSSKTAAYLWASSELDAVAIEVYGPDDYYEAN